MWLRPKHIHIKKLWKTDNASKLKYCNLKAKVPSRFADISLEHQWHVNFVTRCLYEIYMHFNAKYKNENWGVSTTKSATYEFKQLTGRHTMFRTCIQSCSALLHNFNTDMNLSLTWLHDVNLVYFNHSFP